MYFNTNPLKNFIASRKAASAPAGPAAPVDNREELITKRFSEARTGMGAQKEELKRELGMNLDRSAAIRGGRLSDKSREKAFKSLAEGFGQADSGLAQQEIATQEALQAEKSGQKFAAEQAALDRTQQAGQFEKQLGFAKYSFDREFDENLKTNLINSMIAFKDAGFLDKNPDELAGFWQSGFANLYGAGRVPQAPTPTPTPRTGLDALR